MKTVTSVSYTHLDVYKRQVSDFDSSLCQKDNDTYHIVAVEPNKPPYETEIKKDFAKPTCCFGNRKFLCKESTCSCKSNRRNITACNLNKRRTCLLYTSSAIILTDWY